MNPVIFWFRQDLRLTDNPALTLAAQTKAPLFLVYIEESQDHDLPLGDAQKFWLHHSLSSLKEDLKELGHPLHFFKGSAKKILNQLAQELSAQGIFWNRCYEPKLIQRDAELKKTFKEQGLLCETAAGFLLFEPWTLKTQQNDFYKVFTPFWKTARKQLPSDPPLPKPHFSSFHSSHPGISIEELGLISSRHPDYSAFHAFGEKAAHQRLRHFVHHQLADYPEARDFPAQDGTSCLSSFLHFGELSPKQVVHAIEEASCSKDPKEKFLSELGWREFSYHLLYFFPDLISKPFKPNYADFDWKNEKTFLQAWQKGETGIPIVDAGMRQLNQTGWMHNRVRMITASFLVKNGMIDWREGHKWFWDHLLDADLANNSASWQWVFGSGADAAPYFRVFNPILQAQKFDPEGAYIKKYCPELKKLPVPALFDPSSASEEILKKAEITLGKTYPWAICDLIETKNAVLRAYKKIQR